jgi:phosphohistidine phosphatase
MQIFIMRHGQANPMASSDSARELTKQGMLESSKMASWLKENASNIEQVLVSPYIRAQQTANIVSVDSGLSAKISTIDSITPSGDAQQVHDYIDGLCSENNFEQLLIVSHMPLVSYLVAELTFNQESPIFQTAGIAQIDYDVDKMKGELIQLISPFDLL